MNNILSFLALNKCIRCTCLPFLDAIHMYKQNTKPHKRSTPPMVVRLMSIVAPFVSSPIKLCYRQIKPCRNMNSFQSELKEICIHLNPHKKGARKDSLHHMGTAQYP